MTREQWLDTLKVGDRVTRMLGGTIPIEMYVTEITEEFIYCGPWTFDPKTSGEIDDDLPAISGRPDAEGKRVYISYIKPCLL